MLIPQTGRAVLAPASFGQGRHRRQPAIPASGVLVTRFLVSADVERLARFYRDVLGDEVVRTGSRR